MKKLIDIDEIYLTKFRKIVTLQAPEEKITDKLLVNMALYIAYKSIKNGKESLDVDYIKSIF